MKMTPPVAKLSPPLVPASDLMATLHRAAPATLSTGSQRLETVLIVDDESLVRQVVMHTLTRAGYRCLVAANGYEAQRHPGTAGKIHLLVTDFSMPGPNGIELAHWFLTRDPEAKVLIMTGSLWDYLGSGGDRESFAVLAKPFGSAQLQQMVRLILDEAPEVNDYRAKGHCC